MPIVSIKGRNIAKLKPSKKAARNAKRINTETFTKLRPQVCNDFLLVIVWRIKIKLDKKINYYLYVFNIYYK